MKTLPNIHGLGERTARWLPGAVVSVFVIALLIATACSADCLGVSCAPPAAADQSAHQHHGPSASQEPPAQSQPAPENSDCATHGHATVFVAQAATSIAKTPARGVPAAGYPLSLPQLAFALAPARSTLIEIRQFHSPPPASPGILLLRI